MTDFELTVTVAITQQTIADLVVTALEGGSNYWIEDVHPRYAKVADYAEAEKYGKDMVTRTFKADGERYTLNRSAILSGLQVMGEKFPDHLHDILNDNADATTADVFIQCALLGDVVYG